MVLDYLQTMWAQKPVCGLFANNVGSLAAIVGPTSPVFAANVSRQVPLFAGQPADDCGPLHLCYDRVQNGVPRLAEQSPWAQRPAHLVHRAFSGHKSP